MTAPCPDAIPPSHADLPEPGPAPAATGEAPSGGRTRSAERGGAAEQGRQIGPVVTELRLSAFASHRGAAFPIRPVTLFGGPGGSGKTNVLRAYGALARLADGEPLEAVFPDPGACVPEGAVPDAQGRRGFRIGCTADGPAGPVRLDVAVQAEPTLRIVGERLTGGGETLLTTALRDPGRSTVQAAWHTADVVPVTRAPLPDDRLGTALLPLRVAGRTEGQLQVLAAAEQMVVALRSVFRCEPQPRLMRVPAPPGADGLRRNCENIAAVLERVHARSARRRVRLTAAVRAGCAGPVTGLDVERLGDGSLSATVARGEGRATPIGRLGDGELRYLALALVLLTGPGVQAVDTTGEVPSALQALTVLADGFDRDLDARQLRELLSRAVSIGGSGHLRLMGTVTESGAARARQVPGVSVVDLEP
ncbi:ATP-binding protein [Streptomyces sp. NPDC001732]